MLKPLAALVLVALAALPANAASLPSVPSGHPPGPDVLYAPPPAAPQLENRDPHFQAAPLLVSGTEAYQDGEYLYQDFLYDDYGSNTDGAGALPLSPRAGDIKYPTNTARYGGNAADLVEFRIAANPTEVAYRVTLNTLLESDSTIVAIAFDTDGNALTGAATLVPDPGAPFPGTDEAITIWGTGGQHTRFTPLPVTTPLTVTADLDANQLTVIVPRSLSNPSGTWRTTVAVGLRDSVTGGWLRPQMSATATTPGGAGPLDPLPCGIFNLAFRFDEPMLTSDVPPDSDQSDVIRNKTPTTYAHNIDFDALAAGADSSTVPTSGTQVRIFASRLDLGEGRGDIPVPPNFGQFPQYRGQLQPYSLYVPTTYVPGTPAGLALNLHSLGEMYWQYHGALATMTRQIGEDRGDFVATTLSRGPDGWYQHEGEYDVFEVWADVAAHFDLDPDRVVSSGYSMGGYATYRLPTLYPDLFGKAFTQVGPPGDGIWVPPGPPTGGAETLTNLWLENARNVPYLNIAASNDQLVPIAGPRAQNLGAPELGIRGFDQLGYRFRFLVVAGSDHFAMAALGYNFPLATAFLGDGLVDRNPPHVTFAYVPDADDTALGLLHDHAYWVSELALADDTAAAAKGSIDALSHGFGLGDPASTSGTAAGMLGPLSYAETNRTWGPAPAIPVENRLDLVLRNLAGARIDLARAALDPGSTLTLPTNADAAGVLRLDGSFPAGSVVLEDGVVLAGGSGGPSGAVVPVAAGVHTYVITTVPAFELRRVRIRPAVTDGDVILKGRLPALLAQLGLPGSDVTVVLRNGAGTFFSATVPAALLVPNGNGRKVVFRDRTGTLADHVTRLSIGGRRRTALSLRARGLDTSDATAGPFTAEVTIGDVMFAASGSLRAAGVRLVAP